MWCLRGVVKVALLRAGDFIDYCELFIGVFRGVWEISRSYSLGCIEKVVVVVGGVQDICLSSPTASHFT